MDVSTFLNDWLILHSPEIKPRTRDSYADLIRRYIVPALGDIDVEALTPEPVRHLLARIVADGHERTSELVYVLLRCAFADLDHNPMQKVKRPRHHQQRPTPWNDDEIVTYIAACENHRHGLALLLAIMIGLRRGEICGLRWRDVDFHAQEIHIVNQRLRLATGELIDSSPKSASSIRHPPIPSLLLPRLKAERGHPDAYVCALTPSGLSQAHNRLVSVLHLPSLSLHGLRHSFATSSMKHNGDVRALQAILGHSSYSVTMNIYTHPDHEQLSRAVDIPLSYWYTVLQGKPALRI